MKLGHPMWLAISACGWFYFSFSAIVIQPGIPHQRLNRYGCLILDFQFSEVSYINFFPYKVGRLKTDTDSFFIQLQSGSVQAHWTHPFIT